MKTSRKVGLSFLIALVWVAWQPALYAVRFEPEIASALEACSSLEEFTRWISDLSGETTASIHGMPTQILTRYAPSQGAIVAQEYLRLGDQLRGIYVDPPRQKAVNSRTFDRMSGKTEAFGSVVVPAAEARTRRHPSVPKEQSPRDPQERIFSIGSWLFILACVAAAGIALLRIRRVAGSN